MKYLILMYSVFLCVYSHGEDIGFTFNPDHHIDWPIVQQEEEELIGEPDYSYVDINYYSISYRRFPQYQVIYFDGEFQPLTSLKGIYEVQKLLKPRLDVILIINDAGGGFLSWHRKFGKILRNTCTEKKLRTCKVITYVHTRCDSACLDLYLYGDERYAHPNSEFGFHKPFIFTEYLPIYTANALARRYAKFGVSIPWLKNNIHRLFSVENNGFYKTNAGAILESGIVQKVFDNFNLEFVNHYPKKD